MLQVLAVGGYKAAKFGYKHRKGIRKGAKVVRSKTTGRFTKRRKGRKSG